MFYVGRTKMGGHEGGEINSRHFLTFELKATKLSYKDLMSWQIQ